MLLMRIYIDFHDFISIRGTEVQDYVDRFNLSRKREQELHHTWGYNKIKINR